ncbi:MAG: GNAT family N-acetyltransferase [Acidimicrobiales bacterium]
MIRPLAPPDCRDAAELHAQVLGMEFISRFGPGFLRAYYRAWIEAPGGLALGAVDGEGRLAGVVLGAIDPPGHSAAMVRRHGLGLALRMAMAAARRPRLAGEVATTRVRRYARGVARAVAAAPDGAQRVGEVTHLLVAPTAQGAGVGRALVQAAEDVSRRAGVEALVLVTPPDLAARQFYEHLGWERAGELTSRSGEPFVRFLRRLHPPSGPGS